MALTPGTRLGAYEVTGLLGGGGMGEVYKGRDTRLDRTVAIKILASDIADDASLRARFEREAHAVAALDHPHICGIYDVGEANGTHFLVMPYLDGHTLAARLEKGALPVDQALKIAGEVADALDKAHRQGIVHRDVKPANLMLTKAGAKLLDFGLAKLKGPAAPVSMSGMTRLATSAPGTAHGTILGTVQYMAPEQVEGKEADARTDIWALGAVIFEMVTGDRPFHGDTPASIIGAILKDDPPPLSTRQPLVPRSLDRIVGRCLQKDPEQRWQSAADLRFAIQSAVDTSDSVEHARHRDSWRGSRSVAIAAAVVIAASTGVGIGSRYLSSAPAAPSVVQFEVLPPIDAMLSPAPVASTAQLTLDADGRRIAYIALKRRGASQIYIRSVDGRDSRALPGTDGASFPFWSSDGTAIGFFAGRKLKKITLADGAVDVLCDAPNGRGGTWNADGVIVFAGTFNSGLLRIPANGGEPSAATKVESGLGHTWPQFLPDGRHFLYYERSNDPRDRGMYVGELGNPSSAGRVMDTNGLVAYARGHVAFVRNGVLFTQPFNARTLQLSGEPTRVADGVGYFHGITGYNALTVAPGALAYGPSIAMTTSLQWFTRTGTLTGRLGRPNVYNSPRLSFDGKEVAVSVSGKTLNERDIWKFDIARDTELRVTSDPETDWFPVWSPVGQRMFFSSTRLGASTIFQKLGVGQDDVFDQSLARIVSYPDDVSSDGQLLAFTRQGGLGGLGYDIFTASLGDPQRITPFLATAFNEAQARFAPNMRFIAYASDETGAYEVYVRPYPPGNSQWKVSLAGGMQPEWRRDGKELFFLAANGKLMAVPVSTDGAFLPGDPQELFDVDVTESTQPYQNTYAVTGNGQRFLVNTVVDQPTRPALTVILNWTAGLRK